MQVMWSWPLPDIAWLADRDNFGAAGSARTGWPLLAEVRRVPRSRYPFEGLVDQAPHGPPPTRLRRRSEVRAKAAGALWTTQYEPLRSSAGHAPMGRAFQRP